MNKHTFMHVWLIFIMLISNLTLSQALSTHALAGTPSIVFYVKATPSGLKDCSNWTNACDLQKALHLVMSGDQVWVAAGIYYPGEQSTSAFELRDGVQIYGGFPAHGGNGEAERNWLKNITVLSGDIGKDDITDAHGVVTDVGNIVGTNAYHVVVGEGVSRTTVLDGFIITAGYANLTPPNIHGYGGGMFNWAGSPTLNNLIFSGNTAGKGAAYYAGGGMFNIRSSNPVLTNVTFIGNTAGSGGGMYNDSSSPTLNKVTFSGNKAIDASCMNNYKSSPELNGVVFDGNMSSNKGCMDSEVNSNPTLSDVTFSNNSSKYGAGMYNYQSSPILNRVVFSGNVASFVGGAMENEDGSSPILTDVLFSDNTASWAGGGMYNGAKCDPVLRNVAFVNNELTSLPNSGGGSGGAMENYNGASPILTNVTFSGNHAVVGGGIDNWQSHLSLTNVTFIGNTAHSVGAAIFSQESTPTIINTIIWGNTPGDSQMLNARGTSTVTYSIIAGSHPGLGNLNLNPRLSELAENGGFTPTYALLPGSWAIDSGSPDTCPPTDQRGIPRPMQGVEDGSPRCDIGAYEASSVPHQYVPHARQAPSQH